MNMMKIVLIFILVFINPINCLNMFVFPSTSSIHSFYKRRLSRQLNLTDDYSLNRIHTLDVNYNSIKDTSGLTKTQIKVIITVVLIISFIMLIIALFRFKNACRTQETDNLQTDIIRTRASQFSEPSSRRGSVGYYTQRYNRTSHIRSDDQLNISLPSKRLSIPACDQSSKSTAVIVLSSSPGDPTDVTHHHHHVTSSCDRSNTPNQQTTIDIKPVIEVAINQCDDQTPLLISELTSTIKDSSIHTTRKYSLNALLPLVRPSVSHPLCSSLTSTIARGSDVGNSNGVDIKSHRRVSLSSALRRTSFAKQPQAFCSTIDSTNSTKTASPTVLPIDSDSSDRTSLLTRKQKHRKKSSSITPIETITSLSSYQKDFMHKIERFRFIDDSASSTTTVTSPIESIETVNTHLFTSAIEQFDDFVRTKYPVNNNNDYDDDVNSLIDCLNSDLLTNGSYSDLNILNHHTSTKPIPRPQTFNTGSFQPTIIRNQATRSTVPINIPHSVTSFPLAKQRNPVEINGHSRSMDFQSIARSTINDTSSSSTGTLTSIRSITSLEFDDNTKPSGVLVDDDFLPMSSPVDEHFWDMSIKDHYEFNKNGCFPNVGSSPDVEIKHFDLQQLNTLSETSCDEDDDDDNATSLNIQSEILSKPLLIIKSNSPIENRSDDKIPSIHSTTLSEEDDTSSEGNESADNGEIDLVQEFELSQKEEQIKTTNQWPIDDRDVFIIQDDNSISEHETIQMTNNRSQPTSIMKITNTKSNDNFDEQQQQRPKVRFNLDPQYEREREWNKVNKLLGNSVEWTDEFEV